ncbi:hypothetical protein JCM8547_007074 [Rhodosporidiobolus lusitaniae]
MSSIPPPLVLLREDLEPSFSSADDKRSLHLDSPRSPQVLRSVFRLESGRASTKEKEKENSKVEVFSATHAYSHQHEGFLTTLYSGSDVVGKVSLSSLAIGPAGTQDVRANKFYKAPHCFSSRKLFKLEQGGIWVSWRKGEDGSMKLVEHKGKKTVLATVQVVQQERGLILPTKTRLTFHSPLLTSSCVPSPPSPFFPPSSSPPRSPPSSSPSSGLATRASSLSSSHTSCSPSRLVTGEQAGATPLEIALLTLLHHDYLRVEKVRARERERQEEEGEREEMGWDAL